MSASDAPGALAAAATDPAGAPYRRRQALTDLWKSAPASAAEVSVALLADRDHFVRRDAAAGLAAHATPAALHALRGALADSDEEVRRIALRALRASRDPAWRGAIAALASDKSFFLKREAEAALKELDAMAPAASGPKGMPAATPAAPAAAPTPLPLRPKPEPRPEPMAMSRPEPTPTPRSLPPRMSPAVAPPTSLAPLPPIAPEPPPLAILPEIAPDPDLDALPEIAPLPATPTLTPEATAPALSSRPTPWAAEPLSESSTATVRPARPPQAPRAPRPEAPAAKAMSPLLRDPLESAPRPAAPPADESTLSPSSRRILQALRQKAGVRPSPAATARAAGLAAPAAAARALPGSQRCLRCGWALRAGQRFCVFCGSPVAAAGAPALEPLPLAGPAAPPAISRFAVAERPVLRPRPPAADSRASTGCALLVVVGLGFGIFVTQGVWRASREIELARPRSTGWGGPVGQTVRVTLVPTASGPGGGRTFEGVLEGRSPRENVYAVDGRRIRIARDLVMDEVTIPTPRPRRWR